MSRLACFYSREITGGLVCSLLWSVPSPLPCIFLQIGRSSLTIFPPYPVREIAWEHVGDSPGPSVLA